MHLSLWVYKCHMTDYGITERQVRDALKEAPTHTAAAALLGISRMQLYRLKAKYGIEVKRIVA